MIHSMSKPGGAVGRTNHANPKSPMNHGSDNHALDVSPPFPLRFETASQPTRVRAQYYNNLIEAHPLDFSAGPCYYPFRQVRVRGSTLRTSGDVPGTFFAHFLLPS